MFGIDDVAAAMLISGGMAEGVVHRDKCEECWNSNKELQLEYKRRANCIKNNAEKEPIEF